MQTHTLAATTVVDQNDSVRPADSLEKKTISAFGTLVVPLQEKLRRGLALANLFDYDPAIPGDETVVSGCEFSVKMAR